MAGQFELLFSVSFSAVSTITVTHNLDRLQVGVMVRIDNVIQNALINSITPLASNPRNAVVVVLDSVQSGDILISGTDYVFANIPTPEAAAQRDFGSMATDPTEPPTEGDRYFNTALGMLMVYDGVRSKWLSVETWCPAFAHEGRPDDNYLMIGRLRLSSTLGYLVPRNATLCELAYVRKTEPRDPTFKVRTNGTSVAELYSPNNTPTGNDVTFDVDVVAGKKLQVYVANDRASQPVVWLKFRWRV